MKKREVPANLGMSVKEKENEAKVEIRQLQTRFHHEAHKRKFYDANIRRKIQAQEKAIDDLKQAHRHVSLMLSQIYSPRNVIQDNRKRSKVRSLSQTRMQNDALIKERKAQLADLAKQVVELNKKIVKQRDKTWRLLETKSHKKLQKKTELMESCLNQVAVRYNTIMTQNSRLREEIVGLQIEKATYDNSCWKLEKRLAQQNRLLHDAVEQAREGYRLWMEELGKISDIQGMRYREAIQYNLRVLEKKCTLHQKTRLKNFHLTKHKDLSELKKQAKMKEALEAAERVKESENESFEVPYMRLLELSNGHIDDFLEDFMEEDRRFFIRFGDAIRLIVKNDGLRQRIQEIQEDMVAITTEREEVETTQNHVLQELEAKKTEITKEANEHENKCKERSKFLGHIQSLTATLLSDLDCDITKMVKPLGESAMPVFGALENKIKKFLLRESLLHSTSVDRAEHSQALISPLQGVSSFFWVMDRAKLCSPPPDLETTAPQTAEEPLGWDQLRQLVIQGHKEE